MAALVLVAGMLASTTTSADPQHMRTKIQWVAIRGGGGLGVAASLHAFTLRWDYVYWDIFRAALTGGLIGAGIIEGGQGGDGLLWGGTSIGFPWHLDCLGRHEMRVGVAGGVGVGATNALILDAEFENSGSPEDECDEDDGCDVPLVPWVVFGPEVYYVWHFDEHFAFLAGVEFWYGPAIGESEGGAFVGTFFGAAI
jgi:hypothetical protein